MAMGVMGHAGFSEREARDALLPLIRGAIENLADALPSEVITGPISRGDAATVAAHLVSLDSTQPEAAAVYRTLGRQALTLTRASLSDEEAKALAKALED